MPRKWYNAIVRSVVNISPSTKHFTVEVLDEETIDFVAGQFVTFDLPTGEKRLDRWRSYSIASGPDSTTFDLSIVQLENGLGSTYFHQQVEVGSVLQFKGPEGSFVLPVDLPEQLVFICTGTGVAPFRSMILSMESLGIIQNQKVHLIFGTRTQDDILYRKEFEEFGSRYPNFRYDVVLSRDYSWAGYQGYVHQVYEELYGEASKKSMFYLCGWSRMVDEAAKRLADMGYPTSQIKYEIYG